MYLVLSTHTNIYCLCIYFCNLFLFTFFIICVVFVALNSPHFISGNMHFISDKKKFISGNYNQLQLSEKYKKQSSVKSIRKCKKSLYNQPKPYFFKILLWSNFWIDFNKYYTKTFGIVNILIVYLFIMLLWVIFICT